MLKLFGRKRTNKNAKLVPYKYVGTIDAKDIHTTRIDWLSEILKIIRILFPNIPIPDPETPQVPSEPEQPEQPNEPEQPEEPKITIPSGVQAIGAKVMWDKGLRGEDIIIAVIDTGIRNHPDLSDKVIIRKDYTREGGQPRNEHGTHVAGTIAADGEIRGVAYKAKLADYRVLDRNGSGNFDVIVTAIKDAIREGCHVINMSLGGPTDYKPLREAIQEAYDSGVPVIVAAGNEGDGNNITNEFSYPAMYPETFSVGSANFNKLRTAPSEFTNSNNEVDCCAQGEEVISTGPNNNYISLSGTSMASPHIAGAAALIIQEFKSQNKSYTTADVYSKLIEYAKDVYLQGRDNSTGSGFVTFNTSL